MKTSITVSASLLLSMLLGACGASDDASERAQVSQQPLISFPTFPASGLIYATEVGRTFCIEGPDLHINTCLGTRAQEFTFTSAQEIRGMGNRCVTSGGKNAPVQLLTCDNRAGQKFQSFNSNAGAALRSGALCLGLRDGNTNDGTPLAMTECNDPSPQRWDTIGFHTSDRAFAFASVTMDPNAARQQFSYGEYFASRNELQEVGLDKMRSVLVPSKSRVTVCEHENTAAPCASYTNTTNDSEHWVIPNSVPGVSYVKVTPILVAYSEPHGQGKSQVFERGIYRGNQQELAEVGDNAVTFLDMGGHTVAKLCDQGSGLANDLCERFASSHAPLEFSDLNDKTSYIEVSHRVVTYSGVSFGMATPGQGTINLLDPGVYRVSDGSLREPIGSISVPMGMMVRLCTEEGGGFGAGLCQTFLKSTDELPVGLFSKVRFAQVRSAPFAIIDLPKALGTVGRFAKLSGLASDAEDGSLSGASLRWTSSRAGLLGTGKTLTVQLAEGLHKITLTAQDSDGLRGEASRSIWVRHGQVRECPEGQHLENVCCDLGEPGCSRPPCKMVCVLD